MSTFINWHLELSELSLWCGSGLFGKCQMPQIEGVLSKGPYLPCVSMAGRALLAGYHWYTVRRCMRMLLNRALFCCSAALAHGAINWILLISTSFFTLVGGSLAVHGKLGLWANLRCCCRHFGTNLPGGAHCSWWQLCCCCCSQNSAPCKRTSDNGATGQCHAAPGPWLLILC